MQKSLMQTFDETAAEAYKAFPRELEKLVVVLASSDTPVYVSPEIAEQLTKDTAAIKADVKDFVKGMRGRYTPGSAPSDYDLAGTLVDLIALDGKNIRGDFNRKFTKEMQALLILDHEIGHHILKNGSYEGPMQLAESAADVYSVLRHIQRFGKDTHHAGALAKRRATGIAIGLENRHYTSDAVQKALQVSEKTDISHLSLRRTAALADKIAIECQLNQKRLEKILAAFQPVKKSWETHVGSLQELNRRLADDDRDVYLLLCREVLSVMKKHKDDADIFKAGTRYLSSPKRKSFMKEAAKTDAYWQKALCFIDKRDRKRPAFNIQ